MLVPDSFGVTWGVKRGVQVAYWRAEEPYTLLTSIRDAMESDIAKIRVFWKYTR